ncbi:DNA-binding transcriptional regulator, LysR family [Andreprevotia lacus DSM 23236]|jgi:DNA-binding transcriptional LysR family regulator|uniref:DNA-binding transcriptional regulator, LysR family n=1 Tax=Andreprevotia lacus DSM 23236 TaxID=1121001 RepID=A0A1W1X5A2_9NEIS|nr:LysR substrate-binding domain-containing protein [Andreprevotia lacus]SMC19086.1 DNA-binding transcriptional regulator, LysR family [Andreprevotia lacus DSM 23236]
MRRIQFDLDVLRSFVCGVELGSFAQAADRLGRSTSAISAQLKKLEEQVGAPVLRKSGRGLALTPAGEVMLAYARRLLALNDEAADAVRGVELAGQVRIGLQEDFAEHLLTRLLGRFARAHPQVHVEVSIGRNHELLAQQRAGKLDLALAWDSGSDLPGQRLAELPLHWIAAPGLASDGAALPLALLAAPCLLRTAAIDALERAGRSWRVAVTSPSLSGIWAAAAAGLALTVRTRIGMPATLAVIDGLPALPPLGVMLYRAGPRSDAVIDTLGQIVADAVADEMASLNTM